MKLIPLRNPSNGRYLLNGIFERKYKMLDANHIYVVGFNEFKIASVLILEVEIAISFNVILY